MNKYQRRAMYVAPILVAVCVVWILLHPGYGSAIDNVEAAPGSNNSYLPNIAVNYDPLKKVVADLVIQAVPELNSFRVDKMDPASMITAIDAGGPIPLPYVSISPTGGLLSSPGTVDVSLSGTIQLADDFQAYLAQGGNAPVDIATPPVTFYRGNESGNPESSVILSLQPDEGWAGGFVATANGWSFIEPIVPLLNRAGIDPAPYQEALGAYDHVVYNIQELDYEPPHAVGEDGEELPLRPQDFSYTERLFPSSIRLDPGGLGSPSDNSSPEHQDPNDGESLPTTIVTFALWADYEFSAAEAGVPGDAPLTTDDLLASWFRIMLTVAGVQEALHTVDPNYDIQVLNVRFEETPVGQCLAATTRGGLLSESRSCSHTELDTAELVHVFSGKIEGGLAFIRGLLGPPNCTARFTPFICDQQTNSGEHVNHGVEGRSGTLAAQILLASHEYGHNFGATHGRGNSRWGFSDDVLLAGDFMVGDNLGYGDILCGHQVGGQIDFWACDNIPRGYYDPMIGGTVLSGSLRSLRPPYLKSISDAGFPGDLYLAGDFNNDQLLDVAIGHPTGGSVEWSVALHRDDSNYKLIAPVVWHSGLGSTGDQFFAGDFTGDGVTDIGFTGAGLGNNLTWTVARSTGSNFSLSSPGGQWTSDIGDQGDILLADDFTGDDKTDVAIGHDTGSVMIEWRVAVSAGGKFITSPPHPIWNDGAGEVGDGFFTGDFDGDEKSDLAVAHPVSASQVEWRIGLSNGTIFIGPVVWAADIGSQGDRFFILDLNYDNRSDVVYGHPAAGSPNGPYAWSGHESNGAGFETWFHPLSSDVCIWNTPPDCGTGIMLYGYGYGYNGRVVNSFSWSNMNTILSVKDVLDAFPP